MRKMCGSAAPASKNWLSPRLQAASCARPCGTRTPAGSSPGPKDHTRGFPACNYRFFQFLQAENPREGHIANPAQLKQGPSSPFPACSFCIFHFLRAATAAHPSNWPPSRPAEINFLHFCRPKKLPTKLNGLQNHRFPISAGRQNTKSRRNQWKKNFFPRTHLQKC